MAFPRMKLNKILLIVAAGLLVSGAANNLYARSADADINPGEIQKKITDNHEFDVAGLWRSLGIAAELETVYPRVGIDTDSSSVFNECSDCLAEIHLLKWDKRKEKLLALQICQESGFCRFLIFSQQQGAKVDKPRWRFIGHADHDFARHRLPEHKTKMLGDRRYFVMTAQGVSGTGVSLTFERWYEITANGVKEVLSLPVSGHECPDESSLCRSFSAQVIEKSSTGNKIHVSFKVKYSGNYFLIDGKSGAELPLFTRVKRGVYVRAKQRPDFILSARESEITGNEIAGIYNIGALTCEDFIRFNTDDLEKIAAVPDSAAGVWLRRYISGCRPTPEQAGIMRAPAK